MNEITKKRLIRSLVIFSPVFTFIMYLLPWMGTYNASLSGPISIEYDPVYYSYFELLKADFGVYTKLIMYLSLIGVCASLVLHIISVIFTDKEKLLTKIAAITLVAATSILFLSVFAKITPDYTSYAGKSYKWISFMTLPYGILIVYNVASLLYVFKKLFK